MYDNWHATITASGPRAAQTHPTPRLPGFDGQTSTGGVQN